MTLNHDTLSKLLIFAITILCSFRVAADESLHHVGDKALGGTVFFVAVNGMHGLVATNSDQGKTYMNRGVDYCSDSSLFDEEGQSFADWKMPTGIQLKQMYEQQIVIGNFKADRYWASSGDMLRNFKNGARDYDDFSHDHWIRCVRSF